MQGCLTHFNPKSKNPFLLGLLWPKKHQKKPQNSQLVLFRRKILNFHYLSTLSATSRIDSRHVLGGLLSFWFLGKFPKNHHAEVKIQSNHFPRDASVTILERFKNLRPIK